MANTPISTTQYGKYINLQNMSGSDPNAATELGAIFLSGALGSEFLRTHATASLPGLTFTTGSTTVNRILDEDGMGSDSASALATQQSIKAYVDAQILTEDTLAELNDTNITTAADASLLLYDTGTSTWRDAAMSGDATIGDTGVLTLAANSVDSAELTAGSVDLAHMSDNSVDSDQYVDGSIDTAHFAAGSVDAAALATNSVDSAELIDGSVDLSHMSDNSVDSDQYVDGSIDTAHFAAGSVDATAMGANSVDSSELVNGSVDLSHMSDNSVDSDQYVDASIDLAHMSDNSVDSDQYVDGSVDNVHMANSSLTVGSTSISLGATSTTLAGLTSLDCTAANQAIYATAGANTITIGAATSTVKCANDLTVTGDLVVNGTQTAVNSTQLNIEDKKVRLGVPGGMTVDGDATYTLTSNVVTVTNSSHGFSNSEYVYISDPADSITEGVYQISSVADVNTFTFAFTASNVGSATAINHAIDNVTAATGDGGGIFVSVASTTPTGIEWDSTNGWQILGGDLDLAASKNLSFAGTSILADSGGTLTLSNVDALDATTEATIESAIDTLANLTAATSLVTVGALGAGSIAAGFGAIDNGTSNITTGGLLKLDVDGSAINAAGSLTFGAGNDAAVYFDGTDLRLDAPSAAGFSFRSAGTEFGLWDADGLDLASGDAFSIDENSVLNATTLGSAVVASSLTSVGALGGGSIAAGFGAIDNGTSNITTGGKMLIDVDGSAINGAGALTLGAGADAAIYFNGTDLVLDAPASAGHSIRIAGTEVAIWEASGLSLATGDAYSINETSVLNATTLGSAVVASSLTSVGALGAGSITSGFGNIDNGSSTLDCGALTSAAADVTSLSCAGNATVGDDGTGADFTARGVTASQYMFWDASGNGNKGALGFGKTPVSGYIIDCKASDGDIRADAFVTYSDERLKTNINAIANPMDKLQKLCGVSYDMKADGRHDIGFIAQDVQKVVPEVVRDSGDTMGIDYSRLTALLVEAVKSQQVEISTLKDAISQLKK